MNYIEWLKGIYKGNDSPDGDLVEDIIIDKSFPKENSKPRILKYLYLKNACSDCIRTFIRTWYEYKAEMELKSMGF